MTDKQFENKLNKSVTDELNYINETKIYNELQNNTSILIFDLRPRLLCLKSSIPSHTINIPYDEVKESSLLDYNATKYEEYTKDQDLKSRLHRIRRHYVVIILSESKIKRSYIQTMPSKEVLLDEQDAITYKGLLLYQTLRQYKVREIALLNTGFQNFADKYYFLVSLSLGKPLSNRLNGFPSEVIDDRVYIGDQQQATNPDVIKHLGITHIVNVTIHVRNQFEHMGIKYFNIPIDDTEEFKIRGHFLPAYNFIEDVFKQEVDRPVYIKRLSNVNLRNVFSLINDSSHSHDSLEKDLKLSKSIYDKNKKLQVYFKEFFGMKNNNKVLIHCSLGVSRCSTIACMYIMKKFRISLAETLELIRFQREMACPIASFIDELEEFERNGFRFVS